MPDSPQFDHRSATNPNAGKWVVVGMLTFGVIMVAALALYWESYTRPFRDLQEAIAAQYPESAPKVIGGRHKSHQDGNPKVLRLVVQIGSEEFNPEVDEARSRERAQELAALAAEHQDLSQYDQLEVHLLQVIPEKDSLHWSLSQSPEEWGLKSKQPE